MHDALRRLIKPTLIGLAASLFCRARAKSIARRLRLLRNATWAHVLLHVAVSCGATFAYSNTKEAIFNFSMPAKRLDIALNEFAATINATIIFDLKKTQAVNSKPLFGEYDPHSAINLLLQGSAFTAAALGSTWIVRWQPVEKNAMPLDIDPSPLEQTVVVGRYSDSLQQSLVTMRNATKLQEVIYAEDIGRFPATNIAEALKRLTGVSVIRDRGEALFISVRGLPSQFHLQTFNGHEIASNENVRTSQQFGRRFHYHLLPAELIASVAINKSLNASDIEGGIGATVNFHSYKPLDLQDNLIRASLEVGQAQLAKKNDPRASLLTNWVNDNQTLGLTITASLTERSLRQDRALNFSWLEVDASELSFDVPFDKVYTPGGIRPTLELEQRRRFGSVVSLQWKPAENHSFEFNYFGLNQTINYQEFTYGVDYEAEDLQVTNIIWRGDALVGGDVENGSVQIGTESTGIADSNHNIDMIFKGENQKFNYRLLGFASQANSQNDKPIQRTRLRRHNDVAFSFYYPKADAKQVPEIVLNTIRLDDVSAFPGRRLEWRKNKVVQKKYGLSLKADFALSSTSKFEFGANWEQHHHDYNRRDVIVEEGIRGEFFDQSYFSDFPVSNFLNQVDTTQPREWLVPDQSVFWQNVNPSLFEQELTAKDLLNSYTVKETIFSSFYQYAYRGQFVRANAGVRLVGTGQKNQGYLMEPHNSQQVNSVTFSKKYVQYLPAANINWQFKPQWNWRTALGKSLNRPNLQDLSPRLTFDSGDKLSASGGNPQLKPTIAWQFDTALEWYFGKQNLLSATLFGKRLQNFIHNDISDIEIDDKVYSLSSKTNGGGAHVMGLEFESRQVFAPWANKQYKLGISANYTLIDSTADYYHGERRIRDKLEDTAERTANLELFFENQTFNARFNYSWSNGIVREVGVFKTDRRDNRPFGSLDLHLSYEASKALNVFFEMINATNQPEQEFVLDDEFARYSHYGRTFLLGVRASLR